MLDVRSSILADNLDIQLARAPLVYQSDARVKHQRWQGIAAEPSGRGRIIAGANLAGDNFRTVSDNKIRHALVLFGVNGQQLADYVHVARSLQAPREWRRIRAPRRGRRIRPAAPICPCPDRDCAG